MQRTKSSSQTGLSTRPISITTTFKFQKVEKLNSIVNEIAETHQIQPDQDQPQQHIYTQPREMKSGMSDKVLDLIKNRIKTNYDQLYTNYGQNKNKILKQIQEVETNAAGENAMSSKFDSVVKQKAKYDKTKAQFEQKQLKLRKLIDMREQLQAQIGGTHSDLEGGFELSRKWQELENRHKQIEHQSAILQNMLSQRKLIRLNLKERYDKMLEDSTTKQQKTKKMAQSNLNKKGLLTKIEEELSSKSEIKIPLKLAEELSNKLEQYENKHSYSNIIQHQAVLEEQRQNKQFQQIQTERQNSKKEKLKKEAEQKSQYQQCHLLFQIRQYEEEKLKKLCGVDSLSQITNGELSADRASLEHVIAQILSETNKAQLETKLLEQEIEDLLRIQSQGQSKQSIYELQKLCENDEKELSKLSNLCKRKSEKFNQWMTLVELMKRGSDQSLNQIVQDAQNIKKSRIEPNQSGHSKQNVQPERKFRKIIQQESEPTLDCK